MTQDIVIFFFISLVNKYCCKLTIYNLCSKGWDTMMSKTYTSPKETALPGYKILYSKSPVSPSKCYCSVLAAEITDPSKVKS